MGFVGDFVNEKEAGHRDYEASAVIGEKRQGKTTFMKLLIQWYMREYPYRKVLVYDISDAFGPRGNFTGYDTITLDELYNGVKTPEGRREWIGGARRLLRCDEYGNAYNHGEVLKYMVNEFRDGLLVIDEATTVMSDNPSDDRKSILYTHTNARVDLFMIYHSLARVPKRLRGDYWHYYFFKTTDKFSSAKKVQDMGFPNPEEFFNTWLESQKAPHYDTRILQYFTCFTKQFQHKSNI